MFDNLRKLNHENVVIQGITNWKPQIIESTLINFRPKDPRKFLIANIDNELGVLIGLDLLGLSHGIVNIKNKQLIINFVSVPPENIPKDISQYGPKIQSTPKIFT